MIRREDTDECPRCGYPKMKGWDELTADERFAAERLAPAGSAAGQRKKHRFCTRCWYEDAGDRERTA